MSGKSEDVNLRGRLLLSTYLDHRGERVNGRRQLRPDEGIVIEAD